MWCDNCLLVFPLKGGAIAWGVLVAAYSIAGGVFLLISGQYFFFFFPEWQIYGGIGIGVGVAAVLTILALSNKSYIWIRVVKFLWPFVIVISTIRAILMIVQLQRGKDKIVWECNNGGQVWTAEAAASSVSKTGSMPGGFCAAGFNSLNTAFIISLLVDIACQVSRSSFCVFCFDVRALGNGTNRLGQIYMYFLAWRFSKRLEHYSTMKGPFYGGYYNA